MSSLKTKTRPLNITPFVRRFGGATSDAVLDPKTQTFSLPIIRGFIGYLQLKNYCIVFGDPVCSFDAKLLLAKAFHGFAKKNHLEVIYIGASQDFAKQAIGLVSHSLIEFGKELILDPLQNPKKKSGPYGSLIRRKVKQAIKEQITVHEYKGDNLQLESEMQALADTWLAFRTGMQIHISDLHLFSHRSGKRWLYAKKNEEVVGIVLLNELQAKNGWLLNHLIVKPNSFKGVSELLITESIELLEKEGCSFMSFGIIANTKLKQMIGIHPFLKKITHFIFKSARKVFGLDGLHTFWKKFQLDETPSYLLFSNQVSIRSIFHIFFSLKGSFQKEK